MLFVFNEIRLCNLGLNFLEKETSVTKISIQFKVVIFLYVVVSKVSDKQISHTYLLGLQQSCNIDMFLFKSLYNFWDLIIILVVIFLLLLLLLLWRLSILLFSFAYLFTWFNRTTLPKCCKTIKNFIILKQHKEGS